MTNAKEQADDARAARAAFDTHGLIFGFEVATALRALLDAETPTEWEYTASEVLVGGSVGYGPAGTLEDARSRQSEMRRSYPWPEEIGLARRRKAGPWEVVPDE